MELGECALGGMHCGLSKRGYKECVLQITGDRCGWSLASVHWVACIAV